MSKLVAINPKLTGLSYEPGTHWVTIGRADDNAFQIVEASVSGRHCEVRLRGKELDVRDLRSTNGTFIEDRPITETILQAGQTLRLGEVELPNIIQMECLEGHSLILEVRSPQTDGEFYIQAGAIVHASTGWLAGEKAFHQLLSLTNGEFCLKPFREPPEKTLQGRWESLLTEAARARTEGNFSAGADDTILIVKKRSRTMPPRQRNRCPCPEPSPRRQNHPQPNGFGPSPNGACRA
jgi:predicted component of type VI protein secretion system